MLQEARIHRIKALLATFGQVSTERIAQDLGVSRETARRDVLALEAEGRLRRVHGGVVCVVDEGREPPLAVRQAVRAKEKRAIARAAVRLVQPGHTLLIDAGSTTTLLAEELSSMSGLTLVTNGLNVALKLAGAEGGRSANQIILLGGSINAELAATHGDITVAEIHRYHADIAFTSPVGISAQHGATSFEQSEAAIARAMTAQARRVVILADHSKIGQHSRLTYRSLADIDAVITDARARTLPALAEMRAAGAEVVLA